MALLYRCDRCRRLEEPAVEWGDRGGKEWVLPGGWREHGARDLCPDCAKAMRELLEQEAPLDPDDGS